MLKVQDLILINTKMNSQNITIKDLANKIRVKERLLCLVLNGKIKNPMVEMRLIRWLEKR